MKIERNKVEEKNSEIGKSIQENKQRERREENEMGERIDTEKGKTEMDKNGS